MKIVNKRDIFFLIIGGLIFGSLGVVAGSYRANQIQFTPTDNTWNVNTVGGALDDIKQTDKTQIANLQSAVSNKQAVIDQYSAYSLYTGSTTFTPSTSAQTISTNKKMLDSNITINAIPSTYKNLSSTTTATASDIISGKTAYNSDGTKLTGTLPNWTSISLTTHAYTTTISTSTYALTAMQNLFKYFKITNLDNNEYVNQYQFRANYNNNIIDLSINTQYEIANINGFWVNVSSTQANKQAISKYQLNLYN